LKIASMSATEVNYHYNLHTSKLNVSVRKGFNSTQLGSGDISDMNQVWILNNPKAEDCSDTVFWLGLLFCPEVKTNSDIIRK